MLGQRKPRGDDGFTLIELLIVIVILGVILVPLADVVIGVMHNEQATQDRMTLSHDAQLANSFFEQDVAGTGVRDYSGQVQSGTVPFKQSIELNAPYNNNGHTCGTAATPTALLRLLSDDWNTSGAQPVQGMDIVAYYLSGGDLHRLKCEASTSPTSDVIVAHDVVGTPAVACSSTCTSTTVPQTVTLTFNVQTTPTNTYQVVLTGQRRQS